MSKSSDHVSYRATRTGAARGRSVMLSSGSPFPLGDVPIAAASPAGSVDITRPLQRVSSVKQDGPQLDVAIEPTVLRDLFGVANSNVASRLLSQLLNVLQPDPRKPIDAASIEQALSLIEGIHPSDTLEAMNATMLIAAQHAALDSLRRALHPDQSPTGRALYQSLAFKAMRTFAQLLDTLYQGRGRGVTQQIVVKHVTVEAGAQAVLGAIDARTGGGGTQNSRGQSSEARSIPEDHTAGRRAAHDHST